MAENNEKKRFGRRAGIGIGVVVLLSIAFFHVVNKLGSDAILLKLGVDLFGVYAQMVLGVAFLIIGGLSATDILLKKKA